MAFLYDLYSFGWDNRRVGSMALYEITASINHFYEPQVPEHYRPMVEAAQAQKILRAKIFAEFIVLLENFGVLCLAIAKHKKQSFMWTYLNTEPQEVTQFYNQVLSNTDSTSLQRLLKLPSPSVVKKAIVSGSYKRIAGLPDNEDQIKIEDVLYDYENYGGSIARVAELYRENDSKYVKIYNKIKHVFSIVEGDWFNPSLDHRQVAIVLDDKGEFELLPMEQQDVDKEMSGIHFVTIAGSELMALFMSLYRISGLSQ